MPGPKKIRKSITKNWFLGFFDRLTAANHVQLDFFENISLLAYCRDFEPEMRRVGVILAKLSFAEDSKEWTF